MANTTNGSAHPTSPPIHPWDPPTFTDVRSACPGLNTLANHHFLPHSGRGISRDMVLDALHRGLNVGPDMAGLLWAGAHHWNLTHRDDAGLEVFDLDEVSRHDGIEHDGSLTRADARTGDAIGIDRGMVKEFMGHFGELVTAEAAAPVLQERIVANKKDFGVESDGDTVKSNIFSWGNIAMLIGTMGDVRKGVADSKVVEVFLTEERLPIEEGWKLTTTTIDLVTLNVLIANMQLQLGKRTIENYVDRLKCFFIKKPYAHDE